jgi:hypothetical protein
MSDNYPAPSTAGMGCGTVLMLGIGVFLLLPGLLCVVLTSIAPTLSSSNNPFLDWFTFSPWSGLR